MERTKPTPHWNKVTDSTGPQPSPRHGHRAVAINNLMIIFGGGNEGIIDELNVYDAVKNEWSLPSCTGEVPPGCAAHGFVVHSTNVILFGGVAEFCNYTNHLYALQTLSWVWKRLKPRSPKENRPSPRIGHSCTTFKNKIYIFGGLFVENECREQIASATYYLNDLFILDIASYYSPRWEKPTTIGIPPPPRESHAAVIHTNSKGKSMLLIYGGMRGIRLGDLWILDLDSMTWAEVETTDPYPLPRSLHSATVIGEEMYVFGGWVPQSDSSINPFSTKWECTNQLVCLNLNTLKWKEMPTNYSGGNVPGPRAGHSAVAINGRIYVFSGRDGYNKTKNNQLCYNDLWHLEVDYPKSAERVKLIRASSDSLLLNWTSVPSAEKYCLQVQKYEERFLPIPTPPSLVPSLPVSQPPDSMKSAPKVLPINSIPTTSRGMLPLGRPTFRPLIQLTQPEKRTNNHNQRRPIVKTFINPNAERNPTTPSFITPSSPALELTPADKIEVKKSSTQGQSQATPSIKTSKIQAVAGTIPMLNIVQNKTPENSTTTGTPLTKTYKLISANPNERSIKLLPYVVSGLNGPQDTNVRAIFVNPNAGNTTPAIRGKYISVPRTIRITNLGTTRTLDGSVAPIRMPVIGTPATGNRNEAATPLERVTDISQVRPAKISKPNASCITDIESSNTENISRETSLKSEANTSLLLKALEFKRVN